MSDAAKRGRASKRDVIVIDDESASDQPAEKSAKREEEPDPSPQVVQFQQELAKSQDMYQRACHKAREYELRAERAENLLDSKRDVLDGTKKDKGELAWENNALKKEVDILRKEKRELQASLDNAMTKLAPRDRSKPAKKRRRIAAAAEKERLNLLELHEIGDPTNIFQLCRPDSKDSMGMHEAVCLLTRAKENVDWVRFMQRPRAPLMSLSCEACNGLRMIGSNCIDHFLSLQHRKKLMDLDRIAWVSRAAVNFWVREIQPVQQLQPAAESSTFTAVEWPPIDVKKEDEDEEEEDDCEE